MVHYSQAAPSSSSCMCHLLVFFSPLPTRVPLKRQPDTNCDIYGGLQTPEGSLWARGWEVGDLDLEERMAMIDWKPMFCNIFV